MGICSLGESSHLNQPKAGKVARAVKQKYQKRPRILVDPCLVSSKINLNTDYSQPKTLDLLFVHFTIFGARFKHLTLSWVVRFVPIPTPFIGYSGWPITLQLPLDTLASLHNCTRRYARTPVSLLLIGSAVLPWCVPASFVI